MIMNKAVVNYGNKSWGKENESIPNMVKFWIYILLLIPSIICSLLILYHFLSNRVLRNALHNHAIIIFFVLCLICDVTYFPWMLYYYSHEAVWRRTRLFCTVWVFIDWTLYYVQTILFAWSSVERHILIFHEKFVSTRKKRLLVHYLPIIMLTAYCFIYFIVAVLFPQCRNALEEHGMICVRPCLFETFAFYAYDTIMHQILPIIVIVICNIGSLVRIYREKQRLGRTLSYRKHWKMTVQFIFISHLYLLFALPLSLMSLAYLCGVPFNSLVVTAEYSTFFGYCALLISPIASALLLSNIGNENYNFLFLRRRAAIIPIA